MIPPELTPARVALLRLAPVRVAVFKVALIRSTPSRLESVKLPLTGP